ncbi:MAG: hypothetical protein Q4F72_12800, partial [Desulfovibrionaceae bacterium]|nr:hypothetical protein [Desulfovibrionaceae bacterium]
MTGPNLHAQAKRLSLCGFRALVCENPLEGTAPGAPDAAETVLQLHWLDEMREPFRAMLETRGLAPDEALHSEEAGAVAALAVLGLLSLKLVQNRLAARGIAARLADVRQALANAAALVLPDG